MPDQATEPGAADPLDLHGVVPPTVTAFRDDESLNPAATAAHARFVVDRGASAVFPLGTNGEFPMLSADERATVVESVVDEVGGEVPIIAGVGAPSTRRTVDNADAATDAGADGVVVVTPFYYPLDGDGAIAHYERVLEAVDVPTYAYHIPSRTGTQLSLETLGALADAGIAGIKDSSRDVPWLGRAVDRNPELTFLAGSDALLRTGLYVGCAGVVSAASNVAPELVVDLYEAYVAGDEERVREMQRRAYDVRDALKRGPPMAGVKTALSLRKDAPDVGPLRRPLRRMDGSDRAALADDLAAAGVL